MMSTVGISDRSAARCRTDGELDLKVEAVQQGDEAVERERFEAPSHQIGQLLQGQFEQRCRGGTGQPSSTNGVAQAKCEVCFR